MNFSFPYLLAGLIFGVFGVYFFREGKKKVNYSLVSIGITMMVYSYFITNIWLVWALGFVLMLWAFKILKTYYK